MMCWRIKEWAAVCRYRISSGQQCDLSSTKETDYCEFHEAIIHDVGVVQSDVFCDYVRKTKVNTLSLHNFKCKDCHFFATDFAKFSVGVVGREVEFYNFKIHNSYFASISFVGGKFENCEFDECKFLGDFTSFDGVEFSAVTFDRCEFLSFHATKSKFKDCQFINCKFLGADTIFDNECEITGSKSLFSKCRFEPVNHDQLPITQLKMYQCNISLQKVLFDQCRAQVRALDLSWTVLDIPTLTLLITDDTSGVAVPKWLSLYKTSISLSGLSFKGKLLIRQSLQGQEFQPHQINLVGIVFSEMSHCSLIDVDLQLANFRNSILEDCRFERCKWEKQGGRKIIAEDIQDRKPQYKDMDAEAVLNNYIQLKKNFEDARDYQGASDWHYREMEVRQRLIARDAKSKFWRGLRRHFLSFNPWYKYISSYGESYGRALLWLVGLFVVWGMFYWGVGDKTCGEQAFRLSALAMTFQFGKSDIPVNEFQWWLAIAQFILTPIILSLFLLALRRSFRR